MSSDKGEQSLLASALRPLVTTTFCSMNQAWAGC